MIVFSTIAGSSAHAFSGSTYAIKCGTKLTGAPGTTFTMTANIGPCPKNGIIIGSSGVVLNCGGHSIGVSGKWTGILVQNQNSVTIENCIASGDANGGPFETGAGFSVVGAHNFLTHDQASGFATSESAGVGFFIVGSFNTLSRDSARDDGAGFYVKGSSNVIKNDFASEEQGVGGTGFVIKGNSNTIEKDSSTFNNADGFDVKGNANVMIADKSNANGNPDEGVGYGFSVSGNHNRLSNDKSTNNGLDGFLVLAGSGNRLTSNLSNRNSGYGFDDATSGSGTSGTANTYAGDVCSGDTQGGSSPSGLCAP